MRRRLLVIGGWVSLLCCLAVLVLWVRSYLPEYMGMRASQGRLILIFGHPQWVDTFGPSNPRLDAESMIATARSISGGDLKTSDWRVMGFELIVAHTSWGFTVLVIPFWFLFLPLAAVSVAIFAIHRRQERRARSNCCLKCGYDLRATPKRCPECGTVPRANTSR